jgi:soluble lytic murein transglycosylase-like protein
MAMRMRAMAGMFCVCAGTAALAASGGSAASNAGTPADAPQTGWHIVLRNGFDLTCARMAEAGEKTRLYLHPAGEDFVDVPSAEIVETEQVELPVDSAAQPQATSAGGNAMPSATQVDIAALAAGAGAWTQLDPDLIASIIHAESAGNAHAVSHAGAQGLMQLMPGTARLAHVDNSFDATENVFGGAGYFDALMLLYHDDLPRALAAYNAGPAAVAKYHGIPPYRETQTYVARVITEFNRRKRLAARQVAKAATRAQNVQLASAAK